MLSLLKAWVQSPVGELRSHKPPVATKKKIESCVRSVNLRCLLHMSLELIEEAAVRDTHLGVISIQIEFKVMCRW